MKALAGIVGIAVAMAMVGGSASAAGLTPAEAKLKVSGYSYETSGSSDSEVVTGTIISDAPDCQSGRTVELLQERKRGKPRVVGAALSYVYSTDKGFFDVRPDDVDLGKRELIDGSYFVRVGEEAIGAQPCAASKSKPFKIKTPETSFVQSLAYAYFPSGPESEDFYGYIGGGEKKCVADRKLTLFRKKQGRDERSGSTRTDPEGYFSFLVEEKRVAEQDAKPGKYYARIEPRSGCREAEPKSNEVSVVIGRTTNEFDYFYFPGRRRGGEDNEFFEGYLRSETPRCYEDREVTIFFEQSGPDMEIGATTTVPLNEGISRYALILADQTAGVPETESGVYYAVAEERARCTGARTADLDIQR